MKIFDNSIKPQNFAEQIVWYLILGTYVFYFLGIQSLIIPGTIWLLAFYLAQTLWQQNKYTSANEKITISRTAWIWAICVTLMIPVLIISHLDFDTGTFRLTKSILKWSREWAVWALIPLIASLNIRPKLVYRAISLLCLQSFPFIILSYLAFMANVPEMLFTSPLHVLGGDSDMYSVTAFILDYQHHIPRITLYSPWAPNLAMIAMIYFFIVRQESNTKIKFLATICAVVMIITPISRTAIVCFPFLILISWLFTNFSQPIIYFCTGLGVFLTGLFAPILISFADTFIAKFHSARASSSALRITLVRMSLDKWWRDAPIWGHGYTKAVGPAYTYYYPIGTSGCGTWVNLLYTKGIIGFSAIFVAMLWTLIDLLIKAQKSTTAKVGLSVLLVFLVFSFVEELDLLAYLYWPGILIIGLAIKEENFA